MPDSVLRPRAHALMEGFLAHTTEYAFIFLDTEGVIIDWAGAAPRVFGHTRDEVIGTPISRLFTQADLDRGIDQHELATARTQGRSEDDRWHVRRDGVAIWVSGVLQAVRDHRNQLAGYVKVVRDRTDLRARTEAADHKLESARAAEQRARSVTRTLGHELRNPLAPLQNVLAILARTCTDGVSRQALAVAGDQLAVLRRLADDLMDASRVDTAQLTLRLELTHLDDAVREAVLEFMPASLEKGLTLDAVLPPAPLPVRIDRDRFRQVLQNLLSNAIKYTPAGGSVWLRATQEGAEVLLRVEDTGIGIDSALLPQIFELFTRGERAREAAPDGLGIGLALVQEVVRLHGGTVQARSPGPGKGSEFTLRLPAAAAAVTSPGPD